MKTLSEINLNYSRAVHQAEQLESMAKDLKELAVNDFQECLNDIAANWQGENARAYIDKANRLKRDLEKSASRLEKVSGTIRNIAKRTRDADITARNIALSSDGE